MKKLSVVLVVVLSICLVASLAFATHHMTMGTVKSVDAKAGSIVITVDGKDQTLKADKGVDLGAVKAGDKVEFAADKDMVKEIKAAAKPKPKAAVGC